MKNPSDNISYRHTLPIQLRFGDFDRFGHVNNVVYFQFYDLGKSDYFATVCPHVDWSAIGIVAVHITADFLSQIRGTDDVAVQTAVTAIGTKSFTLAQRVIDLRTNEVKCVGTSVMVTYDLKALESIPLRQEWIEAICAYEGKDVRKEKKYHP